MNSKKKTIKFTALMTALCVIVAYFSVLSPTTAYYYKSEEQNLELQFSLFDIRQTLSDRAISFDLKAATKFEDFGENLFDEVVYTQTISAKNAGSVPAKLYVDVEVPQESASNGLKYIILFNEIPREVPQITEVGETTTASPVTTVPAPSGSVKGALKSEIESKLNAYNSAFVDGVSESSAVMILDGYNESLKAFSYAPLVPVGSTVEVKVVFWAEYGIIENTLKNTDVISNYTYSANVTVTAAQNTEEASPFASN